MRTDSHTIRSPAGPLAAALVSLAVAISAVPAGTATPEPPEHEDPSPGRVARAARATAVESENIADRMQASATAVGGWFGRSVPLQVPAFVDEFPGIDLSSLSDAGREMFLHRANTELCTCGHSGCRRHSLAFCLEVDPACPRARRMLETLAEEIAETHSKTPPSSEGTPDS